MDEKLIEEMARAIRAEIVRQGRDEDKAKWPAGAFDFEEHQAPWLITRACAPIAYRAGLEKAAGIAEELRGQFLPDAQTRYGIVQVAAAIRKAGEV